MAVPSNKRGSSSHRNRDKAKEKGQRDKGDHSSSSQNDNLHDSQQNGATKSSDTSGVGSLSQRLSGSQLNLTQGSGHSGSFSSISTSNVSANAPGPPKDAKVRIYFFVD